MVITNKLSKLLNAKLEQPLLMAVLDADRPDISEAIKQQLALWPDIIELNFSSDATIHLIKEAINFIRGLNPEILISISSKDPALLLVGLELRVDLIHTLSDVRGLKILPLLAAFKVPVIFDYQPKHFGPSIDDLPLANPVVLAAQYYNMSAKRCVDAGLLRNNLLYNPGFGMLGDRVADLTILKNLGYFSRFRSNILLRLSKCSIEGQHFRGLEAPMLPIDHSALAAVAYAKGAQVIAADDLVNLRANLATIKGLLTVNWGKHRQ